MKFATHLHPNVTDVVDGVPAAVTGPYPMYWEDCLEDPNTLSDANFVQHNEIVCATPSGVGANLTMMVFVGGDDVQNSSATPFTFDYDPPHIDFVQPYPVDALGMELTFYGSDLADSNGVRGCCRGALLLCIWP